MIDERGAGWEALERVHRTILAAIEEERARQDAGDRYAAVRWGVYAKVADLVESALEEDQAWRAAALDVVGS